MERVSEQLTSTICITAVDDHIPVQGRVEIQLFNLTFRKYGSALSNATRFKVQTLG